MSAASLQSATSEPLVSDRVQITEAGEVRIAVGKVELGQGILTALAQIAAEELDVSFERVRMVSATTAHSPDEGFTSGSMSVMAAGTALRAACAHARAWLVEAAARRAGVSPETLSVRDGTVLDARGNQLSSYWEFANQGVLERAAGGDVTPKKPDEYSIVGRNAARLDLEDKFLGRPRFIHDLSLPGQLFGRVVRPPAPGAQLVSADADVARSIDTVVSVVQKGSFLGVIAEREDDAVRAAELLRAHARWSDPTPLPVHRAITDYLRSQPAEDTPVAHVVDEAARSEVVNTIQRRYSRPYLAHASIAPGCGIACWHSDDELSVWTHSQGIFPLRDAIAKSCGLDASRVVVHHVEGAGCYGHNSADDVAFDAVLLARETPGRPVQVVWSRDDEFAWEPYGPAMAVEIAVGVDTSGDIVQWRQDVWGNGHVTRPGYDGNIGLLGASEAAMQTVLPAAVDPASYGGGNSRNAVPPYRVRDLEATVHRLLAMPIRTSSMRSLGAMMNVFAIESIIDELAELAEADPVEYRLRQLPDERARAVVAAAAELAGWKDRKSSDGWGWGIAYARYKNTHAHCAAVARVEAVSSVEVRNIYVAVDAGQIVNPDGLANQAEGGAVQAASWAVREAIRFDDHQITSRDWESYPILRFSEAPTVSVTLLPRPDEPPLGVGECTAGPVAGAIANALYDAIGVRVRDLPLTPERIEAAILRD